MKKTNLTILILSLFYTVDISGSFAADKRKPLNPHIANNKNGGKIISKEANSIPFYYAKTSIVLQRKSLPSVQPLPWQENLPPQDPALIFDVEIRDAMSLYAQNGWLNLGSYSEKTGLMMVFSEPTIQPIIPSSQYAPTDILFIDKQGKITQIVPNILLSELDQEIYPNMEILAFLFLKGGSCADLSINVGDDIQYSIFKKPPLVISAPKENKEQKQ